jgi:16S rRNA (cytidine1402-2'-O)-methyltransferase
LPVRDAHQSGVTVPPMAGPSAILTALIASGLNLQRFAFHHHLPVKTERRKARRERARDARTGG